MLVLPLLLAASAPVAPAPARPAGLFSAGQLKDRCSSGSAADISYCFAYIAGVYDTVGAYETWLNLREFCAPAGVSQGELRGAFVDYLDAKPGFRAGEAASVVVVALKERFACQPDKRQPAPKR